MHARLLMVTAAASLALAGTAAAAPSDRYTVRNMVSNDRAIVPAERADPLLVNPWGLASSATSPWWPANQGSNTSIITPATNIPNATRANVPGGPTGVVAGPGGRTTSRSPARRPDRRTSSSTRSAARSARWRGGIPNNDSQLGISRANVGAVYMGLTIATPSAAIGPRLYAADFANNRIDIVNAQWQLVDAPGAFVDPNLPAGYGAYGIQTVGNRIIVTYAAKAPAGIRERPGAGLGVVNAFDLNGNFLARVASPGGVLNAPWGTALAHPTFGAFGGDLLIGNFGDGRINAFHENANGTWTPSGTLKGNNNQPLFILGLWALQFGKGNAASGPRRLPVLHGRAERRAGRPVRADHHQPL